VVRCAIVDVLLVDNFSGSELVPEVVVVVIEVSLCGVIECLVVVVVIIVVIMVVVVVDSFSGSSLMLYGVLDIVKIVGVTVVVRESRCGVVNGLCVVLI